MGGRLQIIRPKSLVLTVKIVGQVLNRAVRVMGLMHFWDHSGCIVEDGLEGEAGGRGPERKLGQGSIQLRDVEAETRWGSRKRTDY